VLKRVIREAKAMYYNAMLIASINKCLETLITM
jgi:hypothetical protein